MKKILMGLTMVCSAVAANSVVNVEKGCYEGKNKVDCKTIELKKNCDMVKNKKYKIEKGILNAFFYKCKDENEVKGCYEGRNKVDCKTIETKKNCDMIKNKRYRLPTGTLNAFFYKCKDENEVKGCYEGKNKIDCKTIETKKNCDMIKNKRYRTNTGTLNAYFYKCKEETTKEVKEEKLCIFRKNNKDYRISCDKKSTACGNYSTSFIKNKIYRKKDKNLNVDFFKCEKPEEKLCVANNKLMKCDKVDEICKSKELVKEKKYNKKTKILNISFYKCQLDVIDYCEVNGYKVNCDEVKQYCKNPKFKKVKSYYHLKNKEIKYRKIECEKRDEKEDIECKDSKGKEISCEMKEKNYCNTIMKEKNINKAFGKFYEGRIDCFEPRKDSVVLINEKDESYNYGSITVSKSIASAINGLINKPNLLTTSSVKLNDFKDRKIKSMKLYINYSSSELISINTPSSEIKINYDVLGIILDKQTNKVYLTFENKGKKIEQLVEIKKSLQSIVDLITVQLKKAVKIDARTLMNDLNLNNVSMNNAINKINDYMNKYSNSFYDLTKDSKLLKNLKDDMIKIYQSKKSEKEAEEMLNEIDSNIDGKYDDLDILNEKLKDIDNKRKESYDFDNENKGDKIIRESKDKLVNKVINKNMKKLKEYKESIETLFNSQPFDEQYTMSIINKYNKVLETLISIDPDSEEIFNEKQLNFGNNKIKIIKDQKDAKLESEVSSLIGIVNYIVKNLNDAIDNSAPVSYLEDTLIAYRNTIEKLKTIAPEDSRVKKELEERGDKYIKSIKQEIDSL